MKNKELIIKALEKTAIPTLHITAVSDETVTYLNSKFGGDFYLPQGKKIPVSPEGEELKFLAQINFSETEPLEGFPKQGILQFFIDTDENCFFDKLEDEQLKKELYEIRYYPNPDKTLQQTISYDKKDKNTNYLRTSWMEGKMSFQKEQEILNLSIYMDSEAPWKELGSSLRKKLPSLILKAGYDLENDEEDTDEFFWDFGNWGCKAGGYPAVRQGDIRDDYEEYKSYTTLLFQYDFTTREELEEDTFVFFIKPEDLEACRFDNVLLYWHNCYQKLYLEREK